MTVRLLAMTCGWLTLPLKVVLDGEAGGLVKGLADFAAQKGAQKSAGGHGDQFAPAAANLAAGNRAG